MFIYRYIYVYTHKFILLSLHLTTWYQCYPHNCENNQLPLETLILVEIPHGKG